MHEQCCMWMMSPCASFVVKLECMILLVLEIHFVVVMWNMVLVVGFAGYLPGCIALDLCRKLLRKQETGSVCLGD